MTTLMVLSPVQCYYIGATDIAATMLIREVTRPLSFSKPVEKDLWRLKEERSANLWAALWWVY